MAEFDNNDFSGIRISLASADKIRSWSRGEVKKPETINYRTLKPEKDGLFCEKIFGPTKDWECSCGKYKGIRFKDIVCERCGVEVTSAKVRRDRMGHIELSAPVSHIWYFKGSASSPMATLLEMNNKDLEKVLYFASNIVTRLDSAARDEDALDLEDELRQDLEELDAEYELQVDKLRTRAEEMAADPEAEPMDPDELQEEINELKDEIEDEKWLRNKAYEEFMRLEVKDLVSDEELFREMRKYYSTYFDGGMGAQAVRDLLASMDLPELARELRVVVAEGKGQKRAKAVKRLQIIDAFIKGSTPATNMILDVIPVIPPDLRPMVQLDGGRFAASDLNDLYRRVINRNNRLKRLLDLDAPAIIVNNEKRMLQEAVDALFDNGRRGRPVTGRGGRPLKSFAESLKGKQGRFRQNLLGKRVDYSGRSVIVVDPQLKLHQCGLPKAMALELFKPFVMKRLIEVGKADNIKGAKRAIDRSYPYVWDVLEECITDRLVLLNRAPTLHRLSIQAFEPVLIEGKAIHLHPLVCAPFNADFDGDQMSVHVPLSPEAQAEARILMLSSNNLRSPASGKVLTVPSLDMVIGMYYVTTMDTVAPDAHIPAFSSFADADNAYQARTGLELNSAIQVRLKRDTVVWESFAQPDSPAPHKAGERIVTTVGRIIFNSVLPDDYPFVNFQVKKKDIGLIVNDCCDKYAMSRVEIILDGLKSVGFHYATRAALTISVWDAVIPREAKAEILREADARVEEIDIEAEEGLITMDERRREVIDVWNAAAKDVAHEMEKGFTLENPIFMMADSGARGSITQLRQLAGMRGLMSDVNTKKMLNTKRPMSPDTDPRDLKVIGPDSLELPIKSNFREGLSTLEYFLSTYGARKGLVDTASHTSDSGYLTRRLIDVAQDVIVREEDCGTSEFVEYSIFGDKGLESDLIGRCVAQTIVDPATGEVLADKESYIASVETVETTCAARPSLRSFADAGINSILLRSVVMCRCQHGVCQKCYGWDLSNRRPVNIGTAVGAIAAQSIGEPGTQLTMRTIHSGGVAGEEDITQGLPFVSRAFNIVSVKNSKIVGGREAVLATCSGTLSIDTALNPNEKVLTVTNPETQMSFSATVSERDLVEGLYEGMQINVGDELSKGFVDFKQLRSLTDTATTMHRFVKTIKDVYTGQGVELNEKHIEVIARQMLHRVRVTDTGDSSYLLNEYVDRHEFEDVVNELTLEGKEPPRAQSVILGIARASMASDSWLASASFERTAEVLTKAAIEGKVDHLGDLKANVIIGKRIPAGTGLAAYREVPLTYNGRPIEAISKNAAVLPEWAPQTLRDIENRLPRQSEWLPGKGGYVGGPNSYTHNGRAVSAEDMKLYLFDDLGVSQRWTNKFSEVGIETVGDLIGKTEDELLRIDGIGAKAIEELRDGLELRDLLFILEPDDSYADAEDLGVLLDMVFSPDGDDILLGTASPSTHHNDDELIGGSSLYDASNNPDVINEDYESLDELLNFGRLRQSVAGDDEDEDEDMSVLDALLIDDEE